jgi:AraC-like DNA-binding protein
MPGHPSGAMRVLVDCELILNLSGEGRLRFEDRTIPIHRHQLLFIPPFVPHRFSFAPGAASDHVAVHFDFTPRMPGVAANLQKRRPYHLQLPPGLELPTALALPPGHRIEAAMIELAALAERPAPLLALAAVHHLSGVFLEMVARAGTAAAAAAAGPHPATAAGAKIQRAVEFIRQNAARPLRLEEIVRVAGLSHCHFITRFHAETGCSPLEYHRRERMERAKPLLADAALEIKEIAARLGFPCAFHFSKLFRRIVGLSPTAWRARVLSKTVPK